MITNYISAENSPSFNMGRPSYYCEKDFLMWEKIFELVETTPIPLSVNGLYDQMKEMCSARQQYGGGGFAFYFWFDTEEHKYEFIYHFHKLLRDYSINPILPRSEADVYVLYLKEHQGIDSEEKYQKHLDRMASKGLIVDSWLSMPAFLIEDN